MHENYESLPRRLARLGWTDRQIQRALQEIGEHWRELEGEGRERGLGAEAAARFADERLGNPRLLARQFGDAMRQATWWGRHPVAGFVVLPPLTLVLWFIAWILAVASLDGMAKAFFPTLPRVAEQYLVLFWVAHGIHYLGVMLVPAFFWWRARRSFCGGTWGWWACVVCAIHGFFNHVALRPHSLSWGYGVGMPADWLPVLAPLGVAALARWWEQRNQARRVGSPSGPKSVGVGLGLLLAAAVLGAGCAAPKTPRQRGWIGGEFKVAKPGSPFTSGDIVPAFPQELKGVQSAGILVTELPTNAPAYLGGLREGDLILKVDGRTVRSLRAFRSLIDTTPPATTVPVTCFRAGTTAEHQMVVGRETYTRWHTLSLGLLMSPKWDLWPNPDFSLIALDYRQKEKRVELSSAETRFMESTRRGDAGQEASERGVASREGWEVWLPVVSVGGHNRILSQETVEARLTGRGFGRGGVGSGM